jgi:hypothetical protein
MLDTLAGHLLDLQHVMDLTSRRPFSGIATMVDDRIPPERCVGPQLDWRLRASVPTPGGRIESAYWPYSFTRDMKIPPSARG